MILGYIILYIVLYHVILLYIHLQYIIVYYVIVLSFAPSAAAGWHCDFVRIMCERN